LAKEKLSMFCRAHEKIKLVKENFCSPVRGLRNYVGNYRFSEDAYVILILKYRKQNVQRGVIVAKIRGAW
jgi:hypothetical protein